MNTDEASLNGIGQTSPGSETSAPLNPQTSLPLTFSAEDSLARTYPWLESVRDWLDSGAACSFNSPDSGKLYALSGCLSRMSLGYSVATLAATSGLSSMSWHKAGIGGPTGCLTLSISEYPSDAVGSTLSDILEAMPVSAKYSLSPKAAAGILRRAENRGRSLPQELRDALIALTEAETAPTSSMPPTPKPNSDTPTEPNEPEPWIPPADSQQIRAEHSSPVPLPPERAADTTSPQKRLSRGPSQEPKHTTETPAPSPTTTSSTHDRPQSSVSPASTPTATVTPSPSESKPGHIHASPPTNHGSDQTQGIPSHLTTDPPPLSVRRLTPTECERLQGFPDNWTILPLIPDATPPLGTQ